MSKLKARITSYNVCYTKLLRIIDENEALLKIFPNYTKKIKTVDAFLSANLDVYKCINKEENDYFHIQNENKSGYFSAEIVDITVENDIVIGRMLVVTDITLFVENQKILQNTASMAIEKAESTEMAFLQSQIKPHFLNNTSYNFV